MRVVGGTLAAREAVAGSLQRHARRAKGHLLAPTVHRTTRRPSLLDCVRGAIGSIDALVGLAHTRIQSNTSQQQCNGSAIAIAVRGAHRNNPRRPVHIAFSPSSPPAVPQPPSSRFRADTDVSQAEGGLQLDELVELVHHLLLGDDLLLLVGGERLAAL